MTGGLDMVKAQFRPLKRALQVGLGLGLNLFLGQIASSSAENASPRGTATGMDSSVRPKRRVGSPIM